jgi:hypothetical protein
MPTTKELKQTINKLKFGEMNYLLDAVHEKIRKLEKENYELKDNEKEAMIALGMAYEKRKKLEKENEKLKKDIYDIVGKEDYEKGIWRHRAKRVWD